MHTPWPLLLRWLLALGLWLPLLAAAAAPDDDEAAVQTFTQATVVQEAVAGRPPERVRRPVRLPDEWAGSRPDFEGSMRYWLQFDVPAAQAGRLQAVYIERICSTADVRLNGELVASSGPLTPPYRRNCYHPMLVMLPAGLLYAKGNTLEIELGGHPLARVAARQRAAGLSEIRIGPHEVLRERHEWRLFMKVTVAQISSITAFLLGLFMLALSWKRRAEPAYRYFGLTLLGWALINARLWLRDMPFLGLEPAVVEMLIASLFPPVVAWAALFLLHYGGRPLPGVQRLLVLQCLVVPLTFAAAGTERVFPVATFWYSVYVVELCAVTVFYLVQIWREQRSEFMVMASVLGAISWLIIAEVAVQHHWITLPGVHPVHFVMPLLFLAIGQRLVALFQQALEAAETARVELEQRIVEKTAEIERSYAELADVRVEQVAEAERKRIASDLHDDLGAKLLTIVHTSENDRIATLAREALEEMRLSVRGLTGKPVKIADALADWRAENVSRLGQANVQVEWSSPIDNDERSLSARAYVQTTRILREAVNNIIKHSGASTVSIRCDADDTDFSLVIQDNGRGIPLEVDGRLDRGHGMASMKRRAKQLAGQCLVESSAGYGTVLRLTLPL